MLVASVSPWRDRQRRVEVGARRPSPTSRRTPNRLSSGFSWRWWSTSQPSSATTRSTGSSWTTSLNTRKLLTKTSSMRRGVEYGEVVPCTCSYVGQLVGKPPAGRGTCSPSSASTTVAGCWASQLTSRSEWAPAELPGNRDVAAVVARPQRRGHEQGTWPPALASRCASPASVGTGTPGRRSPGSSGPRRPRPARGWHGRRPRR